MIKIKFWRDFRFAFHCARAARRNTNWLVTVHAYGDGWHGTMNIVAPTVATMMRVGLVGKRGDRFYLKTDITKPPKMVGDGMLPF